MQAVPWVVPLFPLCYQYLIFIGTVGQAKYNKIGQGFTLLLHCLPLTPLHVCVCNASWGLGSQNMRCPGVPLSQGRHLIDIALFFLDTLWGKLPM